MRHLAWSFLIPAASFAATGFTSSDPSNLLGPRSQAQGGATTASKLAHDSLFQNPASGAFGEPAYTVTLGYVGAGDSMVASIVDTKSGPLGGGAYYMRRNFATNPGADFGFGDFRRIEDRAGFALLGKMSDSVALGANVNWLRVDPAESGLKNRKIWNGDLGARVILAPKFTAGLLVRNLLEDRFGYLPRSYVLALETEAVQGLGLSVQGMSTRQNQTSDTELVLPDNSGALGWGLGAEYRATPDFRVRAGYQDQPAWKTRSASAGFGYSGKGFAIDYSYRASVGVGDGQLHAIALSADL
jgi:hypothetical protein